MPQSPRTAVFATSTLDGVIFGPGKGAIVLYALLTAEAEFVSGSRGESDRSTLTLISALDAEGMGLGVVGSGRHNVESKLPSCLPAPIFLADTSDVFILSMDGGLVSIVGHISLSFSLSSPSSCTTTELRIVP